MKNEYEITALVKELKNYLEKYKSRFHKDTYYEIYEMLDKMLPESYNFNDSVFQEIKSNFKKDNKITFVLGAGVSNDFGIPNWEELIYRINFSGYWEKTHFDLNKPEKFDDDNDNDIKHKLEPLFRSQNNLYEWAQYAQNTFDLQIGTRTRWLNVSSSIKEKDLDNKIYSAVKQSLYYKEKIKSKELKSSLDYIAKIIYKYKMDRVVTYNYDDCLEYIIGNNKKRCLPIFDKEQLLKKYKCLKIYHVHGFIPYFSEFKGGGARFNEIEKNLDSWDGRKIILTEVSYDEMSDEIYKWRNAIQVDTFLKYSCFFVGFSATDINFKRILKQISKKTNTNTNLLPKHYISVCLDDYIRNIPKLEPKGFFNINNFIEGLQQDIILEELYPFISSILCMLLDRKKYLERYNIIPLFTTINDLPKLLGKIANKKL